MSECPASIFHLAFTVTDLPAARAFYENTLGCMSQKSSEDWIILNFFGHKATAYLDRSRPAKGPVHDDNPAMRHFGAILSPTDFQDLADRLQACGQEFMIPPTLRDHGTENETWIMMLRDPAGNVLEFNSVLHRDKVFAPY
ncbi:MAG: VOC family protein [Rhizobiaceae bacterium]